MPDQPPQPEKPKRRRWLNRKEVAGELGVSVRTLQKMVDEGRFPKPRKFTSGVHRWTYKDIEVFNYQAECNQLPEADEIEENGPAPTQKKRPKGADET